MAVPRERLPVTILTGFLGSGKTSLLNAMLREPAFCDSAVVVNEFGDIGLDHLLVESAKENVVLMDAGCLCCAVLDSLPETLNDLFARRARGEVPAFQRVIIETTGLADPLPIMRLLSRDPIASHFYRLASVICTVDALFGAGQLDRNPEARVQAGLADRIVITKTDLVDDASLKTLRRRLDATNGGVAIVDSSLTSPPHDLLSADADLDAQVPWLSALSGGEIIDKLPHDRHRDDITSLSLRLDASVTWSGLAEWTAYLREEWGASLLRAKAILNVQGATGPVVLHGVQTLFDLVRLPAWPDDIRQSRLVLIGHNLDRPALTQSLAMLAH